MSGQVGDLSPSQEKSLAQFRANIQDVLSVLPSSEDAFLLRWLRARSFDLQKSEDMLRKTSMMLQVNGHQEQMEDHVEFRKQQDLDHILEWQPPEVLELYSASSVCGHDREGGPIWYHVITHLDLRGLLLSVSRQELLRDKIRICELLLHQCEQQSRKLGKKVEKITAIFDLEGLGLRHLWKPGVEFAQEFLSALEANYPELLRHLIIVRAPSLFAVAFNLVKSYMSPETRKKMVVLRDNWKQELATFISPDQLPVEFGGTMTDPDGNPKCPSKINYGGEVPRRYYLRQQLRSQHERTARLGRGSSRQVEREILRPGCVLRWQFASDGGDIGFGVFLKTKLGERQRAGEMTEVLPSQRYNAHLVPEDGSLTCLEAGVYVLRFDNTYSLVRSKLISYTIEVLLPDQTFTEKVEKF